MFYISRINIHLRFKHSGKSSLIQTIFRLLEISHGRILIDGIDITSMPRNLLRSRLNILPQEAFFVPGTIEHNLLLGTALKPDEEKEARNTKIQEILHAVNLWDKILQLGGIGAVLDPEKMLSQGERQLFCLARALLNPSPILILDEATSRYVPPIHLIFPFLQSSQSS